MIRVLALIAGLAPGLAVAQSVSPPDDMAAMHHRMHGQPGAPSAGFAGPMPREAGQSAFAAVQEIVERLEADPKTDWSEVDIEALRQHLIDMDNVTLRAEVASEAVDGGLRFHVSGVGPVKESIQRMVLAHAATMNGAGGWTFVAALTDAGADLTVITPPRDLIKLKALGFIGVMTRGMHHQAHHLMIALGKRPHG